jgi:hypothetical protein
VHNEQTLLANARQSVKDELKARRKQQRERLHTFWGESYDLLENFARECIPDYYAEGGSDSDTALLSVRKKLYRCNARTREGFLAWAIKQLAKEPHFHLVSDAVNKFDLGLSDLIDTFTLKQGRYADFPEHFKERTATGTLYRLNMGTREDGSPIVWSVPEAYWVFAQRIWPVSLKEKPDGGFYIAKKITGTVVPVHRLILPVTAGDTVQSSSGNFLDWTSLYVRPFNRSGMYEGRRMGWNKDEGRPRTAQETFEHRFQPRKALENYGTNFDGTERFVLPSPVPVNADLAAKTTCWGTVGSTGWADPITPAERDYYAPELPSIPVEKSARRLAAEQKLDRLGL